MNFNYSKNKKYYNFLFFFINLMIIMILTPITFSFSYDLQKNISGFYDRLSEKNNILYKINENLNFLSYFNNNAKLSLLFIEEENNIDYVKLHLKSIDSDKLFFLKTNVQELIGSEKFNTIDFKNTETCFDEKYLFSLLNNKEEFSCLLFQSNNKKVLLKKEINNGFFFNIKKHNEQIFYLLINNLKENLSLFFSSN